MPYMYSEMQNKLSKTRESPLESMGQIISSRCPLAVHKQNKSFLWLCATVLRVYGPPFCKLSEKTMSFVHT